jgi:hypothetical protein
MNLNYNTRNALIYRGYLFVCVLDEILFHRVSFKNIIFTSAVATKENTVFCSSRDPINFFTTVRW